MPRGYLQAQREEQVKLRNKTAVAVTTVGMGIAGIALAPSAFAAYTDCPSGYVCVWNDNNFSPQNTMVKSTVASGHWNLPSGPQDEVSSWYNRTASRKCLLDYWNGTTYTLGYLNAGARTAYVGDAANDRADAVENC